jgi:thiosulfate/3-mercaptopyruvate sulfurtransferase
MDIESRIERGGGMSKFKRISVDEAELIALQKNVLVLDMRDADAYCDGHHPRALHLSDANMRKLIKNTPPKMPILIYCYHGNSSQDMARLFADFGFENCYSVDGGYEAWKQALVPPLQPLSSALIAWLQRHCFDAGNLDARVANNETALMRAARLGEIELTAELLRAGASINIRNADGNNALWFACFSGVEALVQLLIAAGADVDNQNDNGATALIYAASAGKTRIVQLLANGGANTTLSTLDDFTAIDVSQNRDILRFLRTLMQPRAVVNLH